MESMPTTPGGDENSRGRSRFSKVLPLPPDAMAAAKSPALSTTSTSQYSPLPPIPASKLSLPPLPKAIPRKALGMTADQRALSEALARATNSPMFSKSPTVPTTATNHSISAMDSSSGHTSNTAATTATTTPPSDTPPILPPKDTQNRTRENKTPEPFAEPLASPTTTIHALQNGEPELWKRRSTKSDRSLHFDELKLDRSNGSTASPPRKEQSKSSALPQLPRSNTQPPTRKPLPIQKTQTTTEPELMGGKISKLKEKASRSPPFRSSSKDDYAHRPPTPESMTADDRGRRVDKRTVDVPRKALSPRSPDTPPKEQSSAAPRIPVRSDSRNALSLLDNLLNESDSSSTLKPSSTIRSPDTSETVTIRSPQPNPPDASHILLSSHDSSLNNSPITSPSSPIDKALPTPNSASSNETNRKRIDRQSLSNIHFPTLPTPALLPPDAVLPALPLSNVQLDCYQSHKLMRGLRNNVCPVACMVCGKKDTETRWKCTWCCVSACGSCMQVLSSEDVGRDLRVAIERIEIMA